MFPNIHTCSPCLPPSLPPLPPPPHTQPVWFWNALIKLAEVPMTGRDSLCEDTRKHLFHILSNPSMEFYICMHIRGESRFHQPIRTYVVFSFFFTHAYTRDLFLFEMQKRYFRMLVCFLFFFRFL